MKNFLAEILIDPSSAKSLVYDETQHILYTDDYKTSYKILGDVPVILPGDVSLSASPLHQNFQTNFNYTEHYEKDAALFNYFKEEENVVTKDEIRRLHESIFNAVPKDARLILDVGCGSGWLANYFLKRNRQVISMDIS